MATVRAVVFNLGVDCLFSKVARACDKSIHTITSVIYVSYVVAKIIGSLGKNDSLLFHSNLF